MQNLSFSSPLVAIALGALCMIMITISGYDSVILLTDEWK